MPHASGAISHTVAPRGPRIHERQSFNMRDGVALTRGLGVALTPSKAKQRDRETGAEATPRPSLEKRKRQRDNETETERQRDRGCSQGGRHAPESPHSKQAREDGRKGQTGTERDRHGHADTDRDKDRQTGFQPGRERQKE